MKSKILGVLIFSFILSDCASPSLHMINNSNETFEKNQFPYRYVEIEEKETYTNFQLEPAGIPQQTIAPSSKLLSTGILKALEEKCNFKREDVVEIRKVNHKTPQYYEVWVFKDELSKRPDKKSAISVILEKYPNGGGDGIFLLGACHSIPQQVTLMNYAYNEQ